MDEPFTEAGLSLGAYARLHVGCADGGGMLVACGWRGLAGLSIPKRFPPGYLQGGGGAHLSLARGAAGSRGPRPARDRRRAERGGGGAWREPRPIPGQLTGCSNAGAHFAVRSSEAVVSRRLRPWRRCGRRRRR